MNRRDFILQSGAGAAVVGLGTAAVGASTFNSAQPQKAPASATAGKPFLMKLGCQSGPSTEEHFAFFARFGVNNICAAAKPAPGKAYSTADDLRALKDMANRHGLSLDMISTVLLPSTNIDREPHPAIMLADSPERDRDIEAFQTSIRNAALAGIPSIKYNMSILGVLRTGEVPGRGDALYKKWNLAEAKPDKPLTRAGVVDADRFWERISYFLEHVVPVANEYKIRIACHPEDPGVPKSGYMGVDRVLGTVDGLKKFVGIQESPYHGLNFCQGTVSEDLYHPNDELPDVVRWFGTRKKIFNVHFRNIRGHRDNFVETFPDDGDVDFVKMLQVYREVGYDGMMMPDHVPVVPNQPDAAHQEFAFAYGYIRGLLQSAQRLT